MTAMQLLEMQKHLQILDDGDVRFDPPVVILSRRSSNDTPLSGSSGWARKVAMVTAISAKSSGVFCTLLLRRKADHCVCLSAMREDWPWIRSQDPLQIRSDDARVAVR